VDLPQLLDVSYQSNVWSSMLKLNTLFQLYFQRILQVQHGNVTHVM
jgi:hypothetical protein